jgi:hypothetical protein
MDHGSSSEEVEKEGLDDVRGALMIGSISASRPRGVGVIRLGEIDARGYRASGIFGFTHPFFRFSKSLALH